MNKIFGTEESKTDDEIPLLIVVKKNKLRVTFQNEELYFFKTIKFEEILSYIKTVFNLEEPPKSIEKTKSSKITEIKSLYGFRIWIIKNEINLLRNINETLKKNSRAYVKGILVKYEGEEIGKIVIDKNCILLCEVKEGCEFFLFNENVICKWFCDKCMVKMKDDETENYTIKQKISDCKTKVFCSDDCINKYNEKILKNQSQNNIIEERDSSKNIRETRSFNNNIIEKSEIPSGRLINRQNTCYLNSAFQCLKHAEELTTFLLKGETIQKLYTMLNNNNTNDVEIKTSIEFVSLIGKLNKMEGKSYETTEFLDMFTQIPNSDAQKVKFLIGNYLNNLFI